MPDGMNLSHLGIVGLLGGIGFTMCLLLTEVALPSSMQTIAWSETMNRGALVGSPCMFRAKTVWQGGVEPRAWPMEGS